MKTWEAMKCLEEGKKVRNSEWGENEYVVMDPHTKCFVYGTDGQIAYLYTASCEWELYDDRKECSECYKELYRAVMKVFDVDEGDDGLFDEFDVDIKERNGLGNIYVILNNLNKVYKLDK